MRNQTLGMACATTGQHLADLISNPVGELWQRFPITWVRVTKSNPNLALKWFISSRGPCSGSAHKTELRSTPSQLGEAIFEVAVSARDVTTLATSPRQSIIGLAISLSVSDL